MGDRFRRMHPAHPHVPHPRTRVSTSRGDRFAERVACMFGSMGMFYVLVCWQLGWMLAATIGVPLLKSDPYPFVFCLFLSNLIQLWALPVLGVATNRADAKRAAKTDADHEALTHIATQVDEILTVLSQGGEQPFHPQRP